MSRVSAKHLFVSRRAILWLTCIALLIAYAICLPSRIFKDPTSTVIEDRKGNLLGARIAKDGQWRFPYNDSIPSKFEQCILEFEDRYFYYHPGINPVSISRAFKQNIQAGRVISGGSTITMQVMRLSRKGKSRSLFQKMVEIVLSTRLELGYSKQEILSLYVSNAPFGGNVVGLEAASWRYFGRSPFDLSWAEAAVLAVLPNAPSLIYPGKNQTALLNKRNRLLDRLWSNEVIDSTTCYLAKQESLPKKPKPLPRYAPHLLDRLVKTNKGERIRTTLDGNLQLRAAKAVHDHYLKLKDNGIYNGAALVIDVESGDVLAYVGNTSIADPQHGCDVDVIAAQRSTGSVLKPLLYAAMLDDGEILPNTLVSDIPTQISGYAPKNFNLRYVGAVPASKALARSLNVPAVRMLQKHGLERFHYLLHSLGMTSVSYPAGRYGLSLILGGAEGTLWDLTGIYASFSRMLNHYAQYSGQYFSQDLRPPSYLPVQHKEIKETVNNSYQKDFLSAASVWYTYKALLEVHRPDMESGWKSYASSNRIAWKTGTSFGYRDGWAIGTNPQYAVGVWVGNADGEGRPGLTGLGAAAPLLFDVFGLLKTEGWFAPPYDEMRRIAVCRSSGHRAGKICEPVDSAWVQLAGLKTPPCPYHQLIHMDADKKYRVTSECEPVSEMQHVPWFVLPPVQEFYYRSQDPTYQLLPTYRADCITEDDSPVMELIYPRQFTQIYVPKELDGSLGQVVFEVAHRKSETTIHWHLDEDYLASTKHIHELGFQPKSGKHNLTLVDENGNILTKVFHVAGAARSSN